MSDVSTPRADYTYHLDEWKTVTDTFGGQKSVKSETIKYLPLPNGATSASDDKYSQYLSLAMFYNVVRKTSKSLNGLAFRKKPDISLNDDGKLNYILDNCSADNENITQVAKRVLQNTLNIGRCGILVDFPSYQGGITDKVKQSNNLYAYMSVYSAFNIINWNTENKGSTSQLSLVVLKEEYLEFTGFSSQSKTRYRVLELKDGYYQQRVIYKDSNKEDEVYEPKANGQRLTEIPFVFTGSENNNSDIDGSPLIDLANMNIKHYQYYADNALKLHYQSIPLLVATNISKQSADNIKDGGGLSTGATKGVVLGLNEDLKYLEIAETSSLTLEIDKIEQMMISAGAKLVKNDSVNETATTSRIKASSENSELINVMDNVSNGITRALQYMALFEGANQDVKFELNSDIVEEMTDTQLLSIVLSGVTQGTIPKIALFNGIKKSGLLNEAMTYEEFKADLESESESFEIA